MAITALLMCSCIFEDMSDCPNYVEGTGERIDVEFSVSSKDSTETETRSSIIATDNAVQNLNLFVYYDGLLETSGYLESPTSFTMKLFKERSYNMYVLANMGKVTPPQTEDEMIGYLYSIKSVSEIKTALPMAWSLKDYEINVASPRVSIALERLVSRIILSIDSSELEDFKVTSVRLRQGALQMYPYYENGDGGSRASSTSEVGDGDWASTSDLTNLNSGQTAYFYALENCQGVLLPDNRSAESKIPSEIPSNAELCTFLEMTASYSGEYEGVSVSSDNVQYRFYLGSDNCSDFNIRRNSVIKVALTVTKDRIFDESWKVSYGEDLPVISNGLELSQSAISLTVGDESSLSATYYRTVDGSRDAQSDVTSYAAWTSSNSDVATVSSGRIKAIGAGSATITATYNGFRTTCTVTVKEKPVTYTYALELTPTSASLSVGNTVQATASYITYADGVKSATKDVTSSVTWSSSDSGIASVSGGTITGVASGTATITATYNGYNDYTTVTVNNNVTYDLILSPASVSVVSGKTNKLTAILRTFTNGQQTNGSEISSKCTWTCDNTAVATVNEIGLVTGVSPGSAVVTCKYENYTVTGNVTVTSEITYTLELSPSPLVLDRGQTATLIAKYSTYQDGVFQYSQNVASSATWSSASTSIAGVSQGHVSGVGAGSTVITAKYNGITATVSVTVKGQPTLTLGWSSQSMNKGQVMSNAAIYNPNDGTSAQVVTSAATWKTSNAAVATVASGQITAQGSGSATITATYNGLSASCVVTVSDGTTTPVNAYVANINVTSDWVSGNEYKLTLSLTMSDGTKLENVPYTWSIVYAQSPDIPTSTTGEGPLFYIGGGTTYTMAVTLTTTGTYNDSSGNSRKFTTSTSFTHNTSWTP